MPSDNNAVIQDLVKDFDKNACDWCNEYKRKGLSRSSRVLLNYIPDEGLTGKSVLDLGSGPGAFALETLKLGASSSVGVDLSAGMINVANDLAQNLGVGDQAKFEVGNAATAQLPSFRHCGNGQDDLLLSRCGPFAGEGSCRVSTLSRFHRSQRSRTPQDRAEDRLFLENLVEKIRRKRSGWLYLHSLGRIDGRLREAGFERKRRGVSGFWLVFLYAKRTPASL